MTENKFGNCARLQKKVTFPRLCTDMIVNVYESFISHSVNIDIAVKTEEFAPYVF